METCRICLITALVACSCFAAIVAALSSKQHTNRDPEFRLMAMLFVSATCPR